MTSDVQQNAIKQGRHFAEGMRLSLPCSRGSNNSQKEIAVGITIVRISIVRILILVSSK